MEEKIKTKTFWVWKTDNNTDYYPKDILGMFDNRKDANEAMLDYLKNFIDANDLVRIESRYGSLETGILSGSVYLKSLSETYTLEEWNVPFGCIDF